MKKKQGHRNDRGIDSTIARFQTCKAHQRIRTKQKRLAWMRELRKTLMSCPGLRLVASTQKDAFQIRFFSSKRRM